MKILVIGDSCTDVYIYGINDRLAPAAPVPVFIPTETKSNGGMAQNVFANLQSLGADVTLIANKEDSTKTRYVDSKTNHMFLRVDSGEQKFKRIENLTTDTLESYDAIVISDYNKGFLESDDIKFIADNHDLVFLDTKKHLGAWCKNCNFIKINEKEYNATLHTLHEIGFATLDNLIVTLSESGCRYQAVVYPVKQVEVRDLTGAGDTFLAGLVVKYLQTKSATDAIKYANECATEVVQQKGVSIVYGPEDI